MELLHTVEQLRSSLSEARAEGKSVGLVPTMGALHAGHASLIERSLAECDLTVVSVFLNPTQFNDPADLERYPTNLAADCQLIDSLGGNALVFAPSVKEIYPEPDTRSFSYPPTDEVMEGAHRPGHFNGVCQIVSKLFTFTQPDRAYFGEKDFQQIAVIRRMNEALDFGIDIVSCPVVREESGLAMSSRNALLTAKERTIAPYIYNILRQSHELMQSKTVAEVEAWVVDTINAHEALRVEYYSIVNGATLASVASWGESDDIVGCITVYCGATPIRLIDHIRYK